MLIHERVVVYLVGERLYSKLLLLLHLEIIIITGLEEIKERFYGWRALVGKE